MSPDWILLAVPAFAGLVVLTLSRFIIAKAMPGTASKGISTVAAQEGANGLQHTAALPPEAEQPPATPDGLLDLIPYQERKRRGRIVGSIKLLVTIGAIAALLALALLGAGQAISSWVSSAAHKGN
ncbi:MAG: hypothetical protein NVSMB57_15950 [Actinomycetota bacterium]